MTYPNVDSPRLKAAIMNGANSANAHNIRLDGKSGYHKVIFIKRGTGSLMLEGQTAGFGPNTLLYIPDHCPHNLKLGVNSHAIVFGVTTNATIPLPVGPVLAKVERSADITAVGQLFDTAFHEFNSGDQDAQMAVESYIGLMTVHMNRISQLTSVESEAPQASIRLMRRFAYLVEERFDNGETLETLAKELGVTPTHLTRVCQTLNSKSASHFIQDRVLGEAKFMLGQTSFKIQDIAEKLGFTSAAYFSRFFHTKTNETPKGYRNRLKSLIAEYETAMEAEVA